MAKAKEKYHVYYTEAELDVDIDNDNYRFDVLQVFIGERAISLEITANCRRLETAVNRFSAGYKAALADGIIPAAIVEVIKGWHLENLVETSREDGEPLENYFYGIATMPDGTLVNAFEFENEIEDSFYIRCTAPYESNGIEKNFPTVYVDSLTTETPDYSGNETLLKGSRAAAIRVAKWNVKVLSEEVGELSAAFKKEQAVVDELAAKKANGEYIYEPDLDRARDKANRANDKLTAKQAELDEAKSALKAAEAMPTEIVKPAAEIATVDDDNEAPGEDEVLTVTVPEVGVEVELPVESAGTPIFIRRPARHVETTYLDVTASANTSEELYDFSVFMTDLLIVNRSSGEGYEPHDIWQSGDSEWLMTFEASVTEASYGEITAYAKERGVCVFGKVDGNSWKDWRILVERREIDNTQPDNPVAPAASEVNTQAKNWEGFEMRKFKLNSTDNLVDVEIEVSGDEITAEDIYSYGIEQAAKSGWSDLLQIDYDGAETGVTVSFIGIAPEPLIDALRDYIGKTDATFSGTVKETEKIPSVKAARKAKAAQATKSEYLLNVEMTAYAPTRFQLSQLRTLLIHIDQRGKAESVELDHSSWLDGEIAGDVTSLTFTANIFPSTYDTILKAATRNNITLKGTIDGEAVVEGTRLLTPPSLKLGRPPKSSAPHSTKSEIPNRLGICTHFRLERAPSV